MTVDLDNTDNTEGPGPSGQRFQPRTADQNDELRQQTRLHRAQVTAGTLPGYGPGDIEVGDRVRHLDLWFEVTRVNRKSVTLRAPGADHTLPYPKIDDVIPATRWTERETPLPTDTR